MGNGLMCIPKKDGENIVGTRSRRSQRSWMSAEEELLHRQALSMAIELHQLQLSQRFDGSMSMSRRMGSTGSRRRATSDRISDGKQDPLVLENIETKNVVLVHGEGFGAWCWYKSISLLEEAGMLPTTIDLSGSGIESTDTNSVSSLAEYSKPLIDLLHNLPENEKVILVGHSCGGASISYAMERFPTKVSKAVFISATMVSDGQSPFDVFAEELASSEIFLQESKYLVYGNGNDKPPTGLMFEKEQIKWLYFNQSPPKDIALAVVSMRPVALGPIMEKLSLSIEKYGSVRRFFIQTLEDCVISPDLQEKLIRNNLPEGVYKIKGSDHCPFFSKAQSLHKILLEIAQLP